MESFCIGQKNGMGEGSEMGEYVRKDGQSLRYPT